MYAIRSYYAFLPPISIDMERILFYERHEAVKAYMRANRLNVIETQTGDDRIGLVSAGKSYADLRQSLLDMGLDDAALQRLGVRILRLGMTYPLDDDIVRRFASGLEDIIVIEEKRSFVVITSYSIHYTKLYDLLPEFRGLFLFHPRYL